MWYKLAKYASTLVKYKYLKIALKYSTWLNIFYAHFTPVRAADSPVEFNRVEQIYWTLLMKLWQSSSADECAQLSWRRVCWHLSSVSFLDCVIQWKVLEKASKLALELGMFGPRTVSKIKNKLWCFDAFMSTDSMTPERTPSTEEDDWKAWENMY